MSRICIVQPLLNVVSETFIRTHGERLPGVVAVVHRRNGVPWVGDRPALAQDAFTRAQRKLARMLLRRDWNWEIEEGYASTIRETQAQVVLAEYGPTGLAVARACQRTGVPLVVHFHGYDASAQDVLKRHADAYQRMFEQAAAVIGVSRAMDRQLLALGCPREKLIYAPYGIDCERFEGARPADAAPIFVAVGRFVEKKAPYLTLAAFARVAGEYPEARLRMIGDGALMSVCRDLACGLKIEDKVVFLGAQPHDVVQREMRQARAFVQHSIVASSGDSEGTPLAVLEAGAMGLPVVATRHAGIPDVVVEGKTGLLVPERDVNGMARHMLTLARNSAFAGELGQSAAAHVRQYYTMEQSLMRLSRVLASAARREDMSIVRTEISAEFRASGKSSEGETVGMDLEGCRV